ncbi:outer membrane lipoprotein-sorting protein [Eudoraea sp.]|uniref:outer membrane lipoprotein-sorting protein n=1 Tax=Eudoraea sp. TaxID=1979955 RepID=UPI003C707D78
MNRINLFLFYVFYIVCAQAQDAEQVFEKALDQLLTQNMEMTIEIKEWSSDDKYKTRELNVLMGTFEAGEKIRTVIQQPIKAKGITILIDKKIGEMGLIEIYTPANGKIRKMKATDKNMALVNSGSSISNFGNIDTAKMRFDPLDKEKYKEQDCYKIVLWDTTDSDKGKTEYLIDQTSYKILQFKEYSIDNSEKSTTVLSQYQKVQNSKNKIQPMQILYFDGQSAKKSEIAILQINPRANLSEADFDLEKLIN